MFSLINFTYLELYILKFLEDEKKGMDLVILKVFSSQNASLLS